MSKLRFLRITAVFFSLVVTGEARSDTDGPDLKLGCRHTVTLADTGVNPGNDIDMAFCIGYVKAIAEYTGLTKLLSPRQINVCTPDQWKTEQMIRVFVHYLDNNPQELHKTDFELVFLALGAAFPCNSSE